MGSQRVGYDWATFTSLQQILKHRRLSLGLFWGLKSALPNPSPHWGVSVFLREVRLWPWWGPKVVAEGTGGAEEGRGVWAGPAGGAGSSSPRTGRCWYNTAASGSASAGGGEAAGGARRSLGESPAESAARAGPIRPPLASPTLPAPPRKPRESRAQDRLWQGWGRKGGSLSCLLGSAGSSCLLCLFYENFALLARTGRVKNSFIWVSAGTNGIPDSAFGRVGGDFCL